MLMYACFNGKQKDASIRLCLEPGKYEGNEKTMKNIRENQI